MTGWDFAWVAAYRASGRPFFCAADDEIGAGYYRFANPGDETPAGPFKTSKEAKETTNAEK